MIPSFTPDRAKVVEAVDLVRTGRRELLDQFHLSLLAEKLELSFGIWILPAELHSNGPINSYDLSNALMDIQQDIERKSGQEVTVLLEH